MSGRARKAADFGDRCMSKEIGNERAILISAYESSFFFYVSNYFESNLDVILTYFSAPINIELSKTLNFKKNKREIHKLLGANINLSKI